MVKQVYLCEMCSFAYPRKEMAKECEDWCRKHQSCNIEITTSAVGVLKPV